MQSNQIKIISFSTKDILSPCFTLSDPSSYWRWRLLRNRKMRPCLIFCIPFLRIRQCTFAIAVARAPLLALPPKAVCRLSREPSISSVRSTVRRLHFWSGEIIIGVEKTLVVMRSLNCNHSQNLTYALGPSARNLYDLVQN